MDNIHPSHPRILLLDIHLNDGIDMCVRTTMVKSVSMKVSELSAKEQSSRRWGATLAQFASNGQTPLTAKIPPTNASENEDASM